ncbi:MAG: amino acid permease [Kiritimatiellae bacterium]|jgi:APA family basic amino acid/polyamine antiporter|nr:amino acid permease [Kiritimatiellia bacterium]
MKKKKLGLLDVFCTATGAMISSGLFILPGIAHEYAGPAVIIAYLLAGIMALTGLLSQAELVSAMPKAGGTYFYVTRSMGPAVGTINGIITWLSLCLKTAFALVGMAAFTAVVLPYFNNTLVAIVLCMFFTFLNIGGVKKAGKIQDVLVIGLIITLLIYIILGLPHVEITNFTPFMPHGSQSIFYTAGMVFVSYGGLLKIAAVAEDVENPSKNIALGMIFSLLVVSVLYFLVVFVTSGVLGDAINGSLTPISDGAKAFMGTGGVTLMSLSAILAFVSTANAGIMSSSRYPYALSKDEMLPSMFSKLNSHGMPYVALLLTTFVIVCSLFMELVLLVKVASCVLIVTFMLSCMCVIIMRESRVQNYMPQFLSPLYPWVQIFGIIGCLVLIITMGWQPILATMVIIVASLFFYWFYGRIRTTREFALMHLIARLTSRDLTKNMLEDELKDIIRVRDDIVQDRFDKAIEDAIVLDIKETDVDVDQLFDILSEEFSNHHNISAEYIKKLLWEREKDSSTVITDGLAIPHIILDGENIFDIIVVRVQNGVVFPDSSEVPVKAIFCLAGSKDQRNFHLKALSAIAQVVMNPDFPKKWKAAKNVQALKDIILLSKRMRK